MNEWALLFFLLLTTLILVAVFSGGPSVTPSTVFQFRLTDHRLIPLKNPTERYNLSLDVSRTVLQSNTIVQTPGYPSVIDQGPWGSCTAYSVRYAYLYWMSKLSLSPIEPSTSFWYAASRLIANANNPNYSKTMSDTGSTTTATIQAISQYGTASLTNYPYTASSIFVNPFSPNLQIGVTQHSNLSFTRIPTYAKTKTLPAWRIQGEAFAAQIDAGNAVLVSFYVYANLQTKAVYVTGTIPMPLGNLLGGHAICLIGYTRGLTPEKNIFSFYNSWGTYTGNNGLFTIPWAYIADAKKSGDYWAL